MEKLIEKNSIELIKYTLKRDANCIRISTRYVRTQVTFTKCVVFTMPFHEMVKAKMKDIPTYKLGNNTVHIFSGKTNL